MQIYSEENTTRTPRSPYLTPGVLGKDTCNKTFPIHEFVDDELLRTSRECWVDVPNSETQTN